MNPVIIIPTYVSSRRKKENTSLMATYDHTTPLTEEGELPRCLESIQQAQGNIPVIVLVASNQTIDKQAADKVQAIASRFNGVQSLVIGAPELSLVHQRMEQLGLSAYQDCVSLAGYSALRNLGLVIANIFGFDAAVFVDDDEVIEDEEFLKKAVYGLGKLTKKGIPIIAKTGFFLDANDSFLAAGKTRWYDKSWDQKTWFNEWISRAMKGPRLSRANSVCGGCFALHKQAFDRLAFDPWITRGEDLDYLLNLRMYGSEVWFDNQWNVRHLPPKTTSEGTRFRQDVYRWLYEVRKLEYSRTQIDLLQLKPSALEPYPGPFLNHNARRRLARTARFRALACADKAAYTSAARAARNSAEVYASSNCTRYFEFQHVWPELMTCIENDAMLRSTIVQSSALRRGIDLSAQLPLAQESEQVAGAGAGGGATLGAGVGATLGAGADGALDATMGAGGVNDAAAKGGTAPMPVTHGLSPVGYDPGLTSEIRLNMED